MPFIPEPGVRYDMPAAFGPSVAPGLETGFDVHTAAFSYVTDDAALRALVPAWFTPVGGATVILTYTRMLGMHWMGGRNYNIVSVGTPAEYRGDDEVVSGRYTLAIWESDAAPVLAGRELMGSPKRVADIPDVEIRAKDFAIECREYDALLVRGEAHGFASVDDEELARLQEAGRTAVGLNWKHVPGLDGEPDADYPTALYMTHPIVAAWHGEGTVEFARPTATEAPYSGHIVRTLGQLPVIERRGVLVTETAGSSLHRDRTRRLDRSGPGAAAAVPAVVGESW